MSYFLIADLNKIGIDKAIKVAEFKTNKLAEFIKMLIQTYNHHTVGEMYDEPNYNS